MGTRFGSVLYDLVEATWPSVDSLLTYVSALIIKARSAWTNVKEYMISRCRRALLFYVRQWRLVAILIETRSVDSKNKRLYESDWLCVRTSFGALLLMLIASGPTITTSLATVRSRGGKAN